MMRSQKWLRSLVTLLSASFILNTSNVYPQRTGNFYRDRNRDDGNRNGMPPNNQRRFSEGPPRENIYQRRFGGGGRNRGVFEADSKRRDAERAGRENRRNLLGRSKRFGQWNDPRQNRPEVPFDRPGYGFKETSYENRHEVPNDRPGYGFKETHYGTNSGDKPNEFAGRSGDYAGSDKRFETQPILEREQEAEAARRDDQRNNRVMERDRNRMSNHGGDMRGGFNDRPSPDYWNRPPENMKHRNRDEYKESKSLVFDRDGTFDRSDGRSENMPDSGKLKETVDSKTPVEARIDHQHSDGPENAELQDSDPPSDVVFYNKWYHSMVGSAIRISPALSIFLLLFLPLLYH